MHRRTSVLSPRDTTMLSGWLFADLLLGLAVIFLMATPGGSIITPPVPATPTRTPTPTPTYTPTSIPTAIPTMDPRLFITPSPTPSPEPSPTPTSIVITTLSNQPEVFQFKSDASRLLSTNPTTRQTERDRLRAEILAQIPPRVGNSRAGFVLTFGFSLDKGEAQSISREFNSLLKDALPAVFNQGGVLRDYIDISGKQSRGTVEVQVFLFIENR